MVREGRVFDSVNGKPVFGMGYSVVVLEPGAEVAEGSSGTTITVQPGHGFASADFLLVGADNSETRRYRRVSSVTATTLLVNIDTPVAKGELLINLGADTGSTAADFLGSGVTIYTNSGYTETAIAATVPCDNDGRYRYHHLGIQAWEVALSDAATPIAIYVNTSSSPTSDVGIQSYVGAALPSGFTSHSGARGFYINKASTFSGATALGLFRDGIERWAYGEDYYIGDRSYLVPVYSDKATPSGSSWTSNDVMSVCWGGAELDLGATSPRVPGQSGCDGPKFRFNSFWTPASNVNTYSNAYTLEVYSPTLQTSGSGIYSALFQSVRNAAGNTVAFDSGGLQVNTTGARVSINLINETNGGGTRKAFIAAGKGGATGFGFGTDIPATDTQNWSIYDYAAAAYRLYLGPTGYLGIGTGAAIGTDFITGLFTQNAPTRIKIDNQSAGDAARAGITGTSDVGFFTLEAFSSTLAADATLRKDTMLYTTGSGAMLHFGTGGVKRMTLLDSAAMLGVGIDPPVIEVQINGSMAIKDGVTAPGTISGYAAIYVDTADGDLKVKFGDGTVKTIVVDT